MRHALQVCLLLSLGCMLSRAQQPARSVAVTIDDLPFAQSGPNACAYPELKPLTERLLQPIRDRAVPVTAFAIAGNCPALTDSERREVYRLWMDAGAEFGNHTYSHNGLNTVPIDEYEKDILRGDAALKEWLGVARLRYFRSPMLHTGPELPIKERLEEFLAAHGYQQAPVTFDNSDWMFSAVYSAALARGDTVLAERIREEYVPYMESIVEFFERRSVEVAGREFPQVLLMHANRLNSVMLPALLDMLQQRGYRFVSLEEALRDEVYRLPNNYAGKGGFSWIHRWSMTKGMANKGEPREPAWLLQAYEEMRKGR